MLYNYNEILNLIVVFPISISHLFQVKFLLKDDMIGDLQKQRKNKC